MKNSSIKYKSIAVSLAKRLQEIDYNLLPISDYNKHYIGNLKPTLDYFFKINATCLEEGIKNTAVPISELTVIDYGGGTGFLSMLAKAIGIKQVIYIDINPNSVETIGILKEKTGIGPDVILHGDSDVLNDWCKKNNVIPQLLLATDLIEHIYNLNVFFANIIQINNNIEMVFSTASNPLNLYSKYKLRKMMIDCENETTKNPNLFTLRLQFIQQEFPQLSLSEAKEWSRKTRGLIYADIKTAIETNKPPILDDKYNSCNPEDGSWAERILPISTYRKLLEPYGYRLGVKKIYYNTHKNNVITSTISVFLNIVMFVLGKGGLIFAPVILLSYKKNPPLNPLKGTSENTNITEFKYILLF